MAFDLTTACLTHIMCQSIKALNIYLIISTSLRLSFSYYSHLPDETKWGTERLSNLPKLTQLENGRAKSETKLFVSRVFYVLTTTLC